MKDKILKIINAAWFPGILILVALAVFAVLAFMPPPAEAVATKGTLKVTVTGLRNEKGNALVILYTAGPFSDLHNIAEVREMAIEGDRVTAAFTGISFREYAVFVCHDENKNQKPDSGSTPEAPPIEGIAFSNVAVVPPAVPGFDEAKFSFSQQTKEVIIPIQYWQ